MNFDVFTTNELMTLVESQMDFIDSLDPHSADAADACRKLAQLMSGVQKRVAVRRMRGLDGN